jgi:hypothetical protein
VSWTDFMGGHLLEFIWVPFKADRFQIRWTLCDKFWFRLRVASVCPNINIGRCRYDVDWPLTGTVACHPLFLAVDLQLNPGLGRHIVEVPRSHAVRRTQPVGHLWTSDQLVAQAAACTTHSKSKRQNIHVLRGILTRDPSNQAASDLRVRPHGHRNRRIVLVLSALLQPAWPLSGTAVSLQYFKRGFGWGVSVGKALTSGRVRHSFSLI